MNQYILDRPLKDPYVIVRDPTGASHISLGTEQYDNALSVPDKPGLWHFWLSSNDINQYNHIKWVYKKGVLTKPVEVCEPFVVSKVKGRRLDEQENFINPWEPPTTLDEFEQMVTNEEGSKWRLLDGNKQTVFDYKKLSKVKKLARKLAWRLM